MNFYSLTAPSGAPEELAEEYRSARAVGQLRLGQSRLYFRKGLRVYYIPYGDIRRVFRRVEAVPARLCCGKGELQIENLVVCGEDDRELAQIQLPGTRAARMLMEQLQTLLPGAKFGRPVQV